MKMLECIIHTGNYPDVDCTLSIVLPCCRTVREKGNPGALCLRIAFLLKVNDMSIQLQNKLVTSENT